MRGTNRHESDKPERRVEPRGVLECVLKIGRSGDRAYRASGFWPFPVGRVPSRGASDWLACAAALVWLASQDADAFITTGEHATDFAELAECGIHFSPDTLTDSQQRKILGGIIHQKLNKAEGVLRLARKLTTGMARQFWKDAGK